VFDYWTRGINPSEPCLANGHINPEEVADLNVEVFVTHEHADHYDSVIYGWERQLDDLTYIFGFKPETLTERERMGYAGQTYEYFGPRSHRTVDGMTIHAIESNDAGVGFLVEVDGLRIYHAGDHAGWTDWDTGPEAFKKEIDYLAGKVDQVDFAFVNVTGCRHRDTLALENSVVYTLEKLSPRVFIPTHGLNREYVYEQFSEKIAAHGIDAATITPRFRGDWYHYEGQSIRPQSGATL
jgi:L-ascorbate metabolism protein UlaG (beta-lactamase superfamily)